MEQSKLEIAEIQVALARAVDVQMQELADLQLAFVGGGCADTIGH